MNKKIRSILLFLSFITFSNLNCMQPAQYDKAVPSTIVGAKNLQELKTACQFISYETATAAISKLIKNTPNIIQANSTQQVRMRDLVANYVALIISEFNIRQNFEQITETDFKIRMALEAFHTEFITEKSELSADIFEQSDPSQKQILLEKIFALVVGLNGIEDTMVCLECGADLDAQLTPSCNWKRDALMVAISGGKQDLVDLLIAAGAKTSHNPNNNPANEPTHLSLALKTNSIELITSVVVGMSSMDEPTAIKILKHFKEIQAKR